MLPMVHVSNNKGLRCLIWHDKKQTLKFPRKAPLWAKIKSRQFHQIECTHWACHGLWELTLRADNIPPCPFLLSLLTPGSHVQRVLYIDYITSARQKVRETPNWMQLEVTAPWRNRPAATYWLQLTGTKRFSRIEEFPSSTSCAHS